MSKILQIFKIKELRDKILIVAFLLVCFTFLTNIANATSIRNDATGGDCASIGVWNWNTKTCLLTTDLNDSITISGNGITLDGVNYRLVGNNAGSGIIVDYWKNNIIKNLKIQNFAYGIYISNSENNLIAGNIISNNSETGIILSNSHDNLITENDISDNQISGLEIWYVVPMSDNKIYRNNFINNNYQIYAMLDGSDSFFQSSPIGGNYWSDFDEPIEGCIDLNSNNFCDSPYVFDENGQDSYPWTKQDGWKIPANQPPTISNSNQYKSDGVMPINENGITTEDIVVFKAILSDPDNDQIKLQIELKEFNQSFDEQNLLESSFVDSGSEATITRYGLTDNQYKWRARAIDDKGNKSQWQEFGTAGNVDFEVVPLGRGAAEIAKQLANHPEAYLWAGKGWDYNLNEFVASASILSGYTYYNPNKNGPNQGDFDFGIGVDCSGLITWAFNRVFNPFKHAIDNFVKYVNANGLYSDFQSDAVTETELLPGDVMFFDWDGDNYIDHTAIYVGESGGFNVVSAANETDGIVTRIKDDYKLTPGFKSFGRIHEGNVNMKITAGSPIDLTVADPDGFIIASNSIVSSDEEYIREIPGVLYYLEMEQRSDGNPIDRVYSPVLKTGNYIVNVIPSAGSFSTDTYDLEFIAGNQTIILADNVPISQIPTEGYGVVVEESGFVSPFVPVLIDIKPGSFPNSINLGSGGTVPIAIFGAATFDVTQIDHATVTLANASVKLKGNGQPMVGYQDVNGDSITDMVVHVTTEALQLTGTDVQAELNGFLLDSRNIKGSDSIRVVP